ncbi:MAG: mechanosensitive ion channel family protein [Candidatus Latescibacterota bacterium]|nr:MAG: mechanosensitive ion channel family protein [Candidatus Latescibacterota bacterium]
MQPILSDSRIQAALILLLSIAVARLADHLFVRVLTRLASRTTSDLDNRLIELFHRPIFLSVVLVGVLMSIRTLLHPDPAPVWFERILATIAILIWTYGGGRIITTFLRWLAARRTSLFVHANTLSLFINLTKLLLFAGATYMILVTWGIDISAWLASAGIIGIAVGFAAKDSLANLFAGIFIVTDAPYKIGDYIVFDTGERGRVMHIGLRSTRLLTRDDIEITFPNSIIGAAKIVNESGGPWERERVRVRVSVAYGSDIDQVREVLMDVARSSELVCEHPEPRVRFRAFGDSGLNFELLCWIDLPENRGRVLDALNSDVYKRFRTHAIEIPYPKRDVFIREMPTLVPES